MDDPPEVIRSQMDQTRSDLSEKLESLEHRVSEGMQSTGSVVSDTLSSVRGAVQSVGETLDLRLQVQRHPWIAFGGSVAAGYLVAKLWEPPAQRMTLREAPPTNSWPAIERERPATSPRPNGDHANHGLLGSLVGVMRDLAARGLPLALDYLFRPPEDPVAQTPTTAPGATTLPLSGKTMPGPGRPQMRNSL